MIRIAFDSDNTDDIPANAIALTYSDLIPDQATLTQLQAKFPFGLVLIDRKSGDPTGAASICDVGDTGTYTAAEAPGWYDAKKAAGVQYLTIYDNASSYPAIEKAMGNRVYWRWIADYGKLFIPGYAPGKRPALVQFASAAMLGFHCDASVIWADSWHPELPPPAQSSTWAGSADLLTALDSVGTLLANAANGVTGVRTEIASHQ